MTPRFLPVTPSSEPVFAGIHRDLSGAIAPPIDLMADFETYHPHADAIRQRLERNFTHRHVPKSEPMRELTVEIVLSPQQAMQGGRVPFEIPVARLCARCEGTGKTGFFTCDRCDGQGLSWDSVRMDVLIPKQVADGTRIPVSLTHLGVRNFYLDVCLRVTHA